MKARSLTSRGTRSRGCRSVTLSSGRSAATTSGPWLAQRQTPGLQRNPENRAPIAEMHTTGGGTSRRRSTLLGPNPVLGRHVNLFSEIYTSVGAFEYRPCTEPGCTGTGLSFAPGKSSPPLPEQTRTVPRSRIHGETRPCVSRRRRSSSSTS